MIHHILGPRHEYQRTYTGTTEHQTRGETTPLTEPQRHLRQVRDETTEIHTLADQQPPGQAQVPGRMRLRAGDQTQTQTQHTEWKQPARPIAVEEAASEPGQGGISHQTYRKG